MDTEPGFFNYPRATIERRKLLRQIRRIRWHPDELLPADATDNDRAELTQQLAILENELAQVEAQRESALTRHVQVAVGC
jgi:hypothetical protein